MQVLDQEGQSQIIALDAASGEQRWRLERDEPSAWATPLITEVDGVTAGDHVGHEQGAQRIDLSDGEAQLWECGGLGLNAIPCRHAARGPGAVHDRLSQRQADGDHGGRRGRPDRQRGRDLGDDRRATSYTASPVLLRRPLLRGHRQRHDLLLGRGHGRGPLRGDSACPAGTSLKASPIAAGGHLYVPTESGDVHLIELGDELTRSRARTPWPISSSSPPRWSRAVSSSCAASSHLFCIAEERASRVDMLCLATQPRLALAPQERAPEAQDARVEGILAIRPERYATLRWQSTEEHRFHGEDADGVPVDTPDSSLAAGRVGGRTQANVGVPYKWGGLVHAGAVPGGPGAAAPGPATGPSDASDPRGHRSRAVGVDCSGFVSRCWEPALQALDPQPGSPLLGDRLGRACAGRPAQLVRRARDPVRLLGGRGTTRILLGLRGHLAGRGAQGASPWTVLKRRPASCRSATSPWTRAGRR